MVRNFDIRTILSLITGINYTDDFSKVYELVWFVCNDNLISPLGLKVVKEDVKKHILDLYPELEGLKTTTTKNFSKFLYEIKEKYNNTLPITKLGFELSQVEEKKVR